MNNNILTTSKSARQTFDHLIPTPHGVEISIETLLAADFSTIPRRVALVLMDPCHPKVRITRFESKVTATIVHDVPANDLSGKYGTDRVVEAMMRATSYFPKDKKAAAALPTIQSAALDPRTKEVSWSIGFPSEVAGQTLVEAVDVSNAFVLEHTAGWLAYHS